MKLTTTLPFYEQLDDFFSGKIATGAYASSSSSSFRQ
jgi:hypothetical protein